MKENRSLEYKENTRSATFLKTVSAYANYGDGKIIFGIEDGGTAVGIADPRTACLDLENRINDSIRPVPEYSLEIQDDSTICLTVYEGKYKPYLYRGKAYRRNDTATVEVDRLEYTRLILEGENRSFEELPSGKQDLTFSCLEKELIAQLGIQAMSQDILKTLELYSDSDGFNNAAALLADKNDFKGIEAVRFGEDISEIMSREDFGGKSILEQFHESVRMFGTCYQYEKIEGSERKTIEKIPLKAFREAVANALIHRTWDVDAAVTVSMFQDRIEIRSPGGLPAGISEKEYLNGQISILRNPIIGNVFFRLKYIEKFGTGILRIRQEYAGALEKPVFRVFENSILVVLPVYQTDADTTEAERKILGLLRSGKVLSRAEIDEKTGLGKDRTLRALNALLERNAIEKEGKGRGTRYRL